MDPKALKEEALRQTERSLAQKFGVAPDPDSDEWEEEYRRQFELAKRRQEAGAAPAAGTLVSEGDTLPRLSGTPADERWGVAIRAERLKAVRDKAMRAWLAQSWVTAKAWIDSRDVALPAFLRRVEAQYAEAKRSQDARSGASAAALRERQEAAKALQTKVQRAGITAAALIELIDLCERLKPAALGAKLAEVTDGKRSLRVFEADAERLMVIEKDDKGRRQYAIPRDEGLVGDLKLYAEAQALLKGPA